MTALLVAGPAWDELIDEHRGWLAGFHPQHGRFWEQSLRDDREAALCEASVRRFVEREGGAVEPNVDLFGTDTGGAEQRPDFLCVRADQQFLVEVTCISIETATDVSGLPHPFVPGVPRNYGPLNDPIFKKCPKKNGQASKATLPTLLAVGTLHDHASVLCMSEKFANMLLTGTSMIAWDVNVETGEGIGDAYQITELRSATFLRPQEQSIREARTSLSGLLMCGLGIMPPRVVGILHPYANRPFDPDLLPGVRFGRVRIDHEHRTLASVWPGDTEVAADDSDLPDANT
jgi:hypothetical protein